MTRLTLSERDFIEGGGSIWCIRRIPAMTWQIYKLSWQKEEILDAVVFDEETAIRWVYLLADLESRQDRIAVHHLVKRPCDNPRFPVLGDPCAAVYDASGATSAVLLAISNTLEKARDWLVLARLRLAGKRQLLVQLAFPRRH